MHEQQSPHNIVFCVLCSKSTDKQTFPPTFVCSALVYRTQMCKLLKRCFLLSASARSVTRVGRNSIPPPRLKKKEKKFQTWGEPGNHQIDVGAGQWWSHGRSGPAQSTLKKRTFTANTFPAPFRVSSNYLRPVVSHRPEYYPKETVFREQ